MSLRVDSERRATRDAVSRSCRVRAARPTTNFVSHPRRQILPTIVQCRFNSARLVHVKWRGGQPGDELCARGSYFISPSAGSFPTPRLSFATRYLSSSPQARRDSTP
ncbi:hypothetical protein MRX96_007922 [Rhipicephalus microplus]